MLHCYRRGWLVALAALVVAGFAGVPPASSAATCTPPSPWTILGVTTDTSTDGCLPFNDLSVTTITIRIENTLPIQKVRFSLPPLPPQLVVIDMIPDFTYVGDLETGIEFDLGGCVSGPTPLMTITVLNTAPFSCVPWEFGPGLGGAIEAVDCDGEVKPAAGLYQELYAASVGLDPNCSCQYAERCTGLPPTDLYPPDGAVEIPTDVVMSWAAQPYNMFMYIGTEPDCSDRQFIGLGMNTSYAPDFLLPSTTYYWQIGSADGVCGEITEVHSFTTISTVAADPWTWGAIKSVYR
jgi:hypothetical protein